MKLSFSRCLVRMVPGSLNKGITTKNDASTINLQKAIQDQRHYIEILKQIGLNVKVMPELQDMPDSVFVEDLVIACRDWAIVTNPAMESRRREKSHIKTHLMSHFGVDNPNFRIFDLVSQDEDSQGIYLEGGDVIRYGEKHFFVGITKRTTIQGFERFQKIINTIGMGDSATPVNLLDNQLHLKCIASYLGNGELIGDSRVLSKYPEFRNIPLFDTRDLGGISNVISANGCVITRADSPENFKTRLEKCGFKVYLSENTEFSKLDGDITCRSILV